MSDAALALDHVGIVGRDLAAMAADMEAVGFTLTPLAHHAGGRTGNRCAMLRQGYLELMSIMPAGASATIDRFLARYAGIHTIALGIDDETAVTDRLVRAGMPAPPVAWTERAVDEADLAAPRARFGLITPPDLPEGRVHLIRHMTPEALWQDRFLSHPNHAVSLNEVIVVTGETAPAAARFSRLAGRPVVPDPVGGYALDLSRGTVRLLPPEVSEALLGVATPPSLPWIGGVTVRTDDGNVALRRMVDDRGIAHRTQDDAILVTVAGTVLRFQAAA
jgi:hypothetical protein